MAPVHTVSTFVWFVITNIDNHVIDDRCKAVFALCMSGKDETLARWCVNVVPASQTLAQHWHSTGSTYCVHCMKVVLMNCIERRVVRATDSKNIPFHTKARFINYFSTPSNDLCEDLCVSYGRLKDKRRTHFCTASMLPKSPQTLLIYFYRWKLWITESRCECLSI